MGAVLVQRWVYIKSLTEVDAVLLMPKARTKGVAERVQTRGQTVMPRELITVVWSTADAMAMAIAAVETVVVTEVLVVVVMMVDVGRMMVRRVAKAETGGIVQY